MKHTIFEKGLLASFLALALFLLCAGLSSCSPILKDIIKEKVESKLEEEEIDEDAEPIYELKSVIIDDSGSEGNNDGKLSPGEKATVYVTFSRKNVRGTVYGKFNAESDSQHEPYINWNKSSFNCNIPYNEFEVRFTLYGSDLIPTGNCTVPLFIEAEIDKKPYSFSTSLNFSNPNKAISSDFWGSWIRMDTGDEIYIDAYKITEADNSSKVIQRGIDGYTKDSENVMIQKSSLGSSGNIVYFRKGGAARNFTIGISGFVDNDDENASRAVSGDNSRAVPGDTSRAVSSFKDVKVKRLNGNNMKDTQTVSLSSDGVAHFTAAVADDPQSLTIIPLNIDTSNISETSSVSMTPSFDGENLGTLPIIEKGSWGFKTTYTIDSDEQGLCFANDYKTYELKLSFKNIGDDTCGTSKYSITCDDSNFKFSDSETPTNSSEIDGNFTSIEPSKSKDISLNVKYGSLSKEHVDVPLKITITDSTSSKTWNDSITLRFFRGQVAINVNARSIDQNNPNVNLNGFIIYPDGRAKQFTVSSKNLTTKTERVLVPWNTKDYILAFSGATASTEVGYSFAIEGKAKLADLSGTWSISEINAYDSESGSQKYSGKNNSSATPAVITDYSVPVKAFLNMNDIDFYSINVSSADIQ